MMTFRILFLFSLITCLFACKADNKKPLQETEPVQKEQNNTTTTPASKEDPITKIKNDFQHIEGRLSSLTKKSASFYDGIPHPTEQIGFYDGKNPVKVVTTSYSEHSYQTITYYLNDGELFFVFVQSGGEASIKGPFTNKEIRAYISDGELIRLLEKEITYKDPKKIDLSKVPNKDITSETKNKSDLVNEYASAYPLILSRLKDRKADGRWISTDDSKSGIEIKNGKWIMFYNDQETTSNSTYDYKITTESTADGKTTKHLTLINETDINDKMEYAILEDSEETLSLSYLARGNTLTYKKEQ